MSEDHLIIIDGYNLILRSPELRPIEGRTLEQSRHKLLNLLSWTFGVGEARFIVVFDGAGKGSTESVSGRLSVRYSKSGEKADDLIRTIVEDQVERRERVTVVTADLEIARHARAMGANVSLADLFMASVLEPKRAAANEKPETLSKKELEEWRTLFERAKQSPAEDEDRGAGPH
ncbi:MAG: hypothetical protein HOP12_09935 [Candidatus Eisenbacteria bacterium]|uniref:NYN domain-containing protein n=1 Tax=Eiseniibacteriota bacterium TaxID=2212470 RepID=A0A849SIN3_UNCEI|nr:hypothetical protein [Candidatus Eisenbacteria bacterium]